VTLDTNWYVELGVFELGFVEQVVALYIPATNKIASASGYLVLKRSNRSDEALTVQAKSKRRELDRQEIVAFTMYSTRLADSTERDTSHTWPQRSTLR